MRDAFPIRARGPHFRAALPSGILCLALLLACGAAEPVSPAGSETRLPTTSVAFPDGSSVEAEVALTPEQQARGLMSRPHLPPGQGMLFVGQRAAPRPFWMYGCLIALDLVWMDGARNIVEIVREAPPCRSLAPEACPSYGGTVDSVYALELAAGQADARGLRLGDRLEF